MPGLRKIAFTPAAIAAILVATAGQAQQTPASASPQARAHVLAASFNKSKHVSKVKRGVRKEKYLEVRGLPAVKANPADYSGSYEVQDLRFSLELRVNPNGTVEGRGHEPVDQDARVTRTFTLADARIQGALLTGTQVYANGQRERFEGVFINRTSHQSAGDGGTTEFGLGVAGKAVHISGLTINKFFFRLKP